jgi:hypothetical protein
MVVPHNGGITANDHQPIDGGSSDLETTYQPIELKSSVNEKEQLNASTIK